MVFGFLLLSVFVLVVLAFAMHRTGKDLDYEVDQRVLRIRRGTTHRVWRLRAVDDVRFERTGSIKVAGIRYESAQLVVNQIRREPMVFKHLLVRDSGAWEQMKSVEAALNEAIRRGVDGGTTADIPEELQQARLIEQRNPSRQ